MKCFLVYTILSFLLICSTSCQQNHSGMNHGDNNNQTPVFTTAAEAANKAKSDLLAVLRSDKSINLGLDSAALQRSQPGVPIRQYQLTFDQLQSADSTGFGASGNEGANVVPLADNRNVITVAEVSKSDKGWQVASLGNKETSDDLNALQGILSDTAAGTTTIYNLPHTATKVYGVKRDNTEVYYTNYPGFSIRQGVSADRLLPVIKQQAAEYQKKYGDAIKNQKLAQ